MILADIDTAKVGSGPDEIAYPYQVTSSERHLREVVCRGYGFMAAEKPYRIFVKERKWTRCFFHVSDSREF